jgi:hypothetical protein
MWVFVLEEVDRLLVRSTGIDDLYRLFMLPHDAGKGGFLISLSCTVDPA